jgi:MoxR-like ATPase
MTDPQRPPAELRYADELAALRAADDGPRPPGWQLSPRAVRRFIAGDAAAGLPPKIVGAPSLVDRCVVVLATGRALMLIGEPGTAKSLLSELLAAAISGSSTLLIQGGAGVSEEHVRYGWNYALLVHEGPSRRALVPAPLYTAMSEGRLVRFEELTRCAPEVQDVLLSLLSERAMAVPELTGDDGVLFARPGFNLIATANTRDRGVHEMSSALKRRFAFETLLPIADADAELALVRAESARLLAASGVPAATPDDVLELVVSTFRDLRAMTSTDRLTTTLSTAEAVAVAHAVGVRGWYLRGAAGDPEDVVEALASTTSEPEDLRKLRRYLDNALHRRAGPAWRALHAARHRLDV